MDMTDETKQVGFPGTTGAPDALQRETFTVRRRSKGPVPVDVALPPGPSDGEMARLTRADWSTRAELTDVLGELRRLEQQARTSALGREAADRMRELRSRASQLHSAMASGGAALRVLRATVVENAGGSSGDAAR